MPKKIMLPLKEDILTVLRTGDEVLLTGTMYVGRDAAHKRLVEALDHGKSLPFDVPSQGSSATLVVL